MGHGAGIKRIHEDGTTYDIEGFCLDVQKGDYLVMRSGRVIHIISKVSYSGQNKQHPFGPTDYFEAVGETREGNAAVAMELMRNAP